MLPDQVIDLRTNNIFINPCSFYVFARDDDILCNRVLQYFHEKSLTLRKDINSLKRNSTDNKWTKEMDNKLHHTIQLIGMELKHSPVLHDIYESARQTISIFTYCLASSIPHPSSITNEVARKLFLDEVADKNRITQDGYIEAYSRPAKINAQKGRNTFELHINKNCNPLISFEYYFPNSDLTMKIIEAACLLSNKKENGWNLYLPYLLQHLACLRSSHIFTDMYSRSTPANKEQLSLRMNLKISEEEETQMMKDKSQYQAYLYLFFRQYVKVYPSIPSQLICKQNYHDYSYYHRILNAGTCSLLYNVAWKKNRNKLLLDSSEAFNGADELMVMAAKKEIFELIPYESK